MTKKDNLALTTIYEISKVLSSTLDLQKTLRNVVNILATHLDMRRVMLSLEDEEGVLRVVAATGLSSQEMGSAVFRLGEGVSGEIMRAGSPIVIPDVSKEPRFLNRSGSRDLSDGSVVAYIAVPVKAGREAIGVLSCDRENSDGDVSFQRDVNFLTMVANLVGQTARLHRNVVVERNELMREKHRLQKELQARYKLDNVIGQSKAMQQVFAEVMQAAPSRSTILLRGESGTGKEVIARSIHYSSPRKDRPFIRVNCAALTETILESELFGHEKGAFTGATQERKGRFEMAHGGTLFLDEIGDISPSFQTKLLRVLQEREFERVGGNKPIKVDVRLVAATNRNLEQAVANGEFRADLYYRLNVVMIFLPPLRERREDIPLLVEHFLEKFSRENNRKMSIAPEAMKVMMNCTWPGNVRELENCVERTATMTNGKAIREFDLPCQQNKCLSMSLQPPGMGRAIPIMTADSMHVESAHHTHAPAPAHAYGVQGSAETEADHYDPVAQAGAMPQATTERERLVQAMEQCGWVQAKAARLLGLSARQLGYALQKYNIEVKKF